MPDDLNLQIEGGIAYAQVSVDALGDLFDIPVCVIRQFDIEHLYNQIDDSRFELSEIMPTLDDLDRFLKSEDFIAEFDVFATTESKTAWRHFFKSLESALFFTRPDTSSLLIHKLRSHWIWRWRELQSYARLSVHGVEDFPVDRYGGVELLIRHSAPLEGAFRLCVGPSVFGKAINDRIGADVLNYFYAVEDDLKALNFTLVYSPMDLGAFLSERLGLNPIDLSERADQIVGALNKLRLLSAKCEIDADRKLLRILAVLIVGGMRYKIDQKSKFRFGDVYCLSQSEVSIDLGQNKRTTGGLKDVSVVDYGRKRVRIKSQKTSREAEAIAMGFIRYIEFLGERLNTKETLRNSEALSLIHSLLDRDLRFAYDNLSLSEAGDGNLYSQRLGKLSRRLVRIITRLTAADAGRIYWYSRKDNALRPLGGHAENADSQADLMDDYMDRAPTEIRTGTLCYAALHDGCVKRFAPGLETETDASKAGLYDIHHDVLQPPIQSPFPQARSAVAVPILIYGRVWGVIEVASTTLNNFGDKEIGSIIKIADAIANDLHSLNVTRLFSNLADDIFENRALGAVGRRQNLDNLSDRICELFMGEHASIWMRDVFHRGRFDLSSTTKRGFYRDDVFSDERDVFLRDDALSNTAALFDRNEACHIGVVGEGGFGKKWAQSSDRRRRISENFVGVAIVAFYDRSGNPIGSVSIYSAHKFIGRQWLELGEFISKYASSIAEYLLGLNFEEIGRLQLDQHEIENNVWLTLSRLSKLKEDLGGSDELRIDKTITQRAWNFVDAEIDKTRADVDAYAEQISSIASHSKETRRDVAESIVKTKRSVAPDDIPWTSVREIINTCFQAAKEKYKATGVKLNPDYSLLHYDVQAHQQDLRTIFINLSSNAVKHSSAAATVWVYAREREFTYNIYVRNIAPPLSAEDQELIFEAEHRGNRALVELTEGKGLGLYIARYVCDEYGFELEHSQDKEINDGLVWHDFQVIIPKRFAEKQEDEEVRFT